MTVAVETDFERIAGVKCGWCGGTGKRFLLDYAVPAVRDIEAICQYCHGTGYRYHWMWRECPCKDAVRKDDWGLLWSGYSCERCAYDPSGTHSTGCELCDTGHVLIEGEGDRLLGLLRVARERRFEITFFHDGVVRCRWGLGIGEAVTLGGDDALASVQVKVLEI